MPGAVAAGSGGTGAGGLITGGGGGGDITGVVWVGVCCAEGGELRSAPTGISQRCPGWPWAGFNPAVDGVV